MLISSANSVSISSVAGFAVVGFLAGELVAGGSVALATAKEAGAVLLAFDVGFVVVVGIVTLSRNISAPPTVCRSLFSVGGS